MLLILVSWVYILLLSFLYGREVLSIFFRKSNKKNPLPLHFSLVTILGFVTLTSLASIVNMFIPLGSEIHIGLMLGAVVIVFRQKTELKQDISFYIQSIFPSTSLSLGKFSIPGRLITWGLFGLCLLVALVYSAIPSHYYDEGLYYLQFIKWINEYAIVPGLGNLHPRLAFNSNWHVLSALFSFSFLKGVTFNDLNGLMHLLVAAYGLTGLNNLILGKYNVSNAFRALLILPTHLMLGYLMAPTADTAVIYLIWLVLILFIEKIEAGSLPEFNIQTVLIIFFGIYVCTVKLSAFPIALLPGYLIIQELLKGNPKRIAALIAIGMFIALPWMMRNVVLSGYVFYPFYQIDLIPVDWKMPMELVKEEVHYIEAFAAGESMVRTLPYPEINELTMSQWFPMWFKDLRASNKGIFLLVLLLSAGYGFLFIKNGITQKGKFFKQQAGYLLLFACVFSGLAFWFLKAPDFRFGYAFTVGLYLLSFALIAHLFLKKPKYTSLALWALIGLIGVFYLKPVKDALTKYKCFATNGGGLYAIQPGNPIDMIEETVTTSGGLILYKATCNDQCWGTALPCTPFADIGLELRDPTIGLQAGFKIMNPDIPQYRKLQIGYQPLVGKEASAVRCVGLCE